MAQGNNWRRNGTPAMQMLNFLMELEKTDVKRGSIVAIASACGVHHGSVSRYFKICRQRGILTENLEFTGKGKVWIKSYEKLIEDISVFMQRSGIASSEIPEKVRSLIENVDYHTLACMVRRIREDMDPDGNAMKDKHGAFLREMLEYGKWEVSFALLFPEEDRMYSEENSGFRSPALLIHNRRGSWIELELKEIQVCSRMNHQKITGYFDSIKYVSHGILRSVQKKNLKIRIPLEACSAYRLQGGGMTACVFLSLCFSEGRVHMAERPARLLFWI